MKVSFIRSTAILGAAAAGFMLSCLPASAAMVVCKETNAGGCTGVIGNTGIMAGSDGESSFDPFKFGKDTSDGIVLTADWKAGAATPDAFKPGFWQVIPGTNTWVLPATTPCGSENNVKCEPAAKWILPGKKWGPKQVGRYTITEGDGSESDVIILDNSGAGNSKAIRFTSDFEKAAAAPEPASIALLAAGLAGVVRLRRRKTN